MGATYSSPRITRPGQSIFIATPAYELVKPGYAYSLAMTTSQLTLKGIPFVLSIMHGNCHVDDGRNQLVADFLFDTQCTDLVFIDSDLRWSPEMFEKLIAHDTTDIVAGAYPFKSYPIKFPVGKILNAQESGLLEVSYAPTGFMRIPRSVFEKLIPSQTKTGKGPKPTYRFFERRYTSNTYDGGDVTFCRKWIAEGGKVIVDPRLMLEHIGEWRWSGCFLDHLSKDENRKLHTVNSKDPVPKFKPDNPKTQHMNTPVKGTPVGDIRHLDSEASDALHDIIRGHSPDASDFVALAKAWGNHPWAATPEYVQIAYRMAEALPEGATILECGSGLSTVVLASVAARKKLRHVVLEHADEWRDKVVDWLAELGFLDVDFPHCNFDRDRGWYDYVPDFAPNLLVIDGPPRYLGADRLYPLRQPGLDGAAILIDDASAKIREDIEAIEGEWVPLVLGKRPAVAGRVGASKDALSAA